MFETDKSCPYLHLYKPGLEVIKPLSSSAQLSMKLQLLINAEIVKTNHVMENSGSKLKTY